MSINSINYAMAGSYGAYSQKLTAGTKAKLEQLGLVYDENTTESEGKKMIQQAEIQKNQLTNNNKENNLPQFADNNGQNPLFERAKKLAQQLGITVDKNIDFRELLSKIEKALEREIKSADGDQSKLMQLQNLSSELASIQAESNGSAGYDNTNKALMMSLEMLGEYNKQQLNYLK